jgi:hypothetical protein
MYSLAKTRFSSSLRGRFLESSDHWNCLQFDFHIFPYDNSLVLLHQFPIVVDLVSRRLTGHNYVLSV